MAKELEAKSVEHDGSFSDIRADMEAVKMNLSLISRQTSSMPGRLSECKIDFLNNYVSGRESPIA